MSDTTCQHLTKGKICGGAIDPGEGVCEICGRAPDKGALLATIAAPTTTTAVAVTGTRGTGRTGSGRISRRQGSLSTSRRQSELGGGLVSLPPIPSQDPLTLVMKNPEVAPNKRNCPSCGARVNRMNGFCPQCAGAYDFRPGLKEGDVVAGKYEIKGPIGLGGMGWIYLGHDLILQRWVVLKGVLNEKDPEAAAAAIAERQFLAAVKHPNIVAIYDFVTQGAQGYMVLEYVGGRTVDALRADHDVVDLLSPDDARVVKSRLLRKDIAPEDQHLIVQVTKFGVLPPEEALSYIMAICPAFAYLHAAGFTHNDMKPDNLMIDGDRIKLIDLGAMRKIGDQDGLIFGTEGFFAPEAAEEPTAVSDLYSIGRTLAILLMDFLYKFRTDRDQTTQKVSTHRLIVTGFKTALPGPDTQDVLKRHDSVYRFLLRATHEDPDQRFQSAEEMQFQLFGLLREIIAEQTGPKPADSRTFFNDGLIDGADIQGTMAPLARLLPRLRVDPADPGASQIIGISAMADLGQRIQELSRIVGKRPESVEAKLRLAEAMTDAGRLADAVGVTEKVLQANPFEWRAHWYAGKAHLAGANAARGALQQVELARKAMDRFDRVYFEMPGELAPRLAIAMAAELAGDDEMAAKFYGRVVMIDPGFASAAFGVARCKGRLGDADTAAAALAAVPSAHSMFIPSRLALARIYINADTARRPELLSRASETIALITTESAALHEVSAQLLERAAGAIDQLRLAPSGARLIDTPINQTALKLAAADHYARAGRLAASAGEKARWVDRSNAARPRTLV